MKTLFEGRLGIQQRVLPKYRVPFFEELAARCGAGLSILAGRPRPWEGIEDGGTELRAASVHRVSNFHVGGARHYLCYQADTVRWLHEWNPDVVILEASVRTVSNRALLAAARALGRPVVGWGLGILHWTDWSALEQARRRLLYASFNRFDAMLAYSSKAKSDYASLGIPVERIRVAPNATAEQRVVFPKGLRSDAVTQELAFRRDARIRDLPIVVFLGRLVPGKRVELLLRAFQGLQDEADLVIVGDGIERSRLEERTRELGVRASFLGDRRGADLDRVMMAADVFVMPGLGGLALQEALCWGLPVIVAGGDGSEKDLVRHGENGLLVMPGNELAMREAIRQLVRSPKLRQQMGSASLGIVQRGSGTAAMLQAFVDTLNALRPPRKTSPTPAPALPSTTSVADVDSARRVRRVIVVCKNPIEDLPPALTTVHCLSELADGVRLVTSGITADNTQVFRQRGVEVGEVGSRGRPGTSIGARIAYWMRFRRAAWRALSGEPENALLWISSADTALALGRRLLTKRFVLQINELYDHRPGFRHFLADYVHAARALVVPEATRAAIFRHWYGLKETPMVIPNKPLLHPRERRMPLDGLELPPEFHTVAGQRIVLYQGHVDVLRSLLAVAKAVHYLGADYRLVTMGVDHGSVAALRAVCPTMIHVPPIAAPRHLLVTSHASVGVASYGFESLNSLFCAPNKVWEYSGFGIPILAQRLPALIPYVEAFNAGVCVEFERPEEIAQAIQQLVGNESAYRVGAQRLYESVDVESLFAAALAQADRRP